MPSSLQESQRRAHELLAVSFAFPPLAYPRSGQVARLLKHLRFSTALVCADEEGARLDPTLETDAESRLRACIRVPFPTPGLRRHADRIAARLRLPVWGKVPDEFRSWGRPALKAVNDFAAANDYRPDLVASFGQPMSDHLVGLKLKRLYGVPWVAHFSDPWVDNPFDSRDAVARRVNLSLERRVTERADLLVFTSEETVDLVMSKYPAAWKRKARVLPHSFAPSLYPLNVEGNGDETVVRYTGEFYGRRTPRPLVETLRSILADAPRLLAGVRFELIGQVSEGARAESGLESLPEGLVTTRPPVSYSESLSLAARADGLLIIDAPAERSVFLPSKLVDYVGAARPVLGITPPGASAKLIARLGGWTADPSDAAAMRRATEEFLSHISKTRGGPRATWGEPAVRAEYEARAVADSFEAMLGELLNLTPPAPRPRGLRLEVPAACDAARPDEEVHADGGIKLVRAERPTSGARAAAGTPAVSVVVAAYNAAGFIGDTLASVFAQSFEDFELIVVNDGSRDTPELESALAPYLERIVYVAQENRGAGAARNRALREARAPLVAFLDADDQWLPAYLEEQVAFLEAGGHDLVYADAEIFGDAPFAGRTFMKTAPSEGEVNFASLISGRCNVITSGVLARRELVLGVGLFDEGLRNSEDFDLWVRMIRAGARAGYQKKVLLRYRHHAGSLSGDAVNRVARELFVLDKIETYDLTPEERAEVSRARERLHANVALESGKQHLARGRFGEAREAFERSNASRRSWKLRAVVLALRIAPRLVLWAAKRRLPDSS